MENKVLRDLLERMSISDTSVLKTAEHYLKSIQSKSGLRNISDIAKAVLCIDLASKKSGVTLNNELAFKLSGLKKSNYQNNLHIIEKVLDLHKPLTISELCVRLSCTAVKDLAEDILKAYKEQDTLNRDFSHPQYVTAAVYTASQLKKIKLEKPQVVAASHLKPTQWKELDAEFQNFVKKIGLTQADKKKKKDNINYIEDILADKTNTALVMEKNVSEENGIEDYESWKKRILQQAEEVLRNSDNIS